MDNDYLNNNPNYQQDYAYVWIHDYVNELVDDIDAIQEFTFTGTTPGSQCGPSIVSDQQCGDFFAQNYNYDSSTGQYLSFDRVQGNISSLTVSIANVPEPGTLELLLLGLFGLGHRRKGLT